MCVCIYFCGGIFSKTKINYRKPTKYYQLKNSK